MVRRSDQFVDHAGGVITGLSLNANRAGKPDSCNSSSQD